MGYARCENTDAGKIFIGMVISGMNSPVPNTRSLVWWSHACTLFSGLVL